MIIGTITMIGVASLLAASLPQGTASSPVKAPPPPRVLADDMGKADLPAFREAVRQARAAFDVGDFAAAAAAYETAVSANPKDAKAPYNLGVARYRAGEFEAAAEAFAKSAQRAESDLAASAMYNQGTSAYAQALQAIEPQQPAAGPANSPDPQIGVPPSSEPANAPDLQGAIDAVAKALTHFKDSATADTSDSDSRTNAETAHTLLKELRKQQEKQQKQDQEQE
ncbi:MAG: tetratricopeptide repeat protein, partial [Phycisphaerales bacterium]|nr:tetratricopeptide repeat protein [Phycisphaerales bacterium]